MTSFYWDSYVILETKNALRTFVKAPYWKAVAFKTEKEYNDDIKIYLSDTLVNCRYINLVKRA
jgi:hypothetical protein